MPHSQVTMATETVHNPAEPRHFMRVKPARSHVRILHAGKVLAETDRALYVTEVGRDMHETALYIPPSDISPELAIVPGKTSHCPLKGEASYLALPNEPPIAWCYGTTFDFASAIKGYVAFYRDRVTIEERGPNA